MPSEQKRKAHQTPAPSEVLWVTTRDPTVEHQSRVHEDRRRHQPPGVTAERDVLTETPRRAARRTKVQHGKTADTLEEVSPHRKVAGLVQPSEPLDPDRPVPWAWLSTIRA